MFRYGQGVRVTFGGTPPPAPQGNPHPLGPPLTPRAHAQAHAKGALSASATSSTLRAFKGEGEERTEACTCALAQVHASSLVLGRRETGWISALGGWNDGGGGGSIGGMSVNGTLEIDDCLRIPRAQSTHISQHQIPSTVGAERCLIFPTDDGECAQNVVGVLTRESV